MRHWAKVAGDQARTGKVHPGDVIVVRDGI